MSARAAPRRPGLARQLLERAPRVVPWRVAARNTLGIVLPIALGLASGHLQAGLAIAIGALNTALVDLPGPYRLRMQRMLLSACGTALAALTGSLAGGELAVLVPLVLAWGIAAGLLVAFGTEAAIAGLTSLVVLLVTAAEPRSLPLALATAALMGSGGVLQALLAVAAWPFQRYGPERAALALACRELAASARARTQPGQAPPVTGAMQVLEPLLHGRHRARGPLMERFRILAELLERIRLELLTLADQATAADGEAASTLKRLLEYSARSLDAIASALDRGAAPLPASAALEGFDAALAALEELLARPGHDPRLALARDRATALGAELRAAARNAGFAGSRGRLREQAQEARVPRPLRPRSPLEVLRANLGFSSAALRHALRTGTCVALALAAARLTGMGHGFWIPMTVAVVLRADFSGTWKTGVLRVLGTLAGLVLTTVLLHFGLPGEWPRVLLLAVLAFGFRLLSGVHYGLGVMLLTAMMVVLLAFHGIAPGEAMAARALATVVGSAVALSAYLLWPTWERTRIRPALAKMLDTYRSYLASLARDDVQARADSRGAARAARTNAEASLARLQGEPEREPGLLPLAESLFDQGNRFVRAAMAFEAAGSGRDPAAVEGLREVLEAMDQALASIARCVEHGGEPAMQDLRKRERRLAAALKAADAETPAAGTAMAEALDRMTDSLYGLAHLLAVEA